MSPGRRVLVAVAAALALGIPACSFLFEPAPEHGADAGNPGLDAASPLPDSGAEADTGPPDDGDGLPLANDPCPDQQNELLYGDFSAWSATIFSTAWHFEDAGEVAWSNGDGFLRSPHPEDTYPSRYMIEVRVQLSGILPSDVGVHGSISEPPDGIADTHCAVEWIEGTQWLLLAQDPEDDTLFATTRIDAVPTPFVLRLIVDPPRSWCYLDDLVVQLDGQRQAPGWFGVWMHGGYAAFDELRIWDIPAECEVEPAPPAPAY